MRYLGLFAFLGITMLTAPARADGPALAAAELDRLALDTLKAVHNSGAELYNAGDSAGCFRVYQGALMAVRPYLPHRPAIQSIIESGLADVARSKGVKIQAFRLHEVIEQVRSELKAELKKGQDGGKQPDPATARIDVPTPKLPTTASPTYNPVPAPRVPPPESASRPLPTPSSLPTVEPPSVLDLAPVPKLTPKVGGPKPLAVPLPGDAPPPRPAAGVRVGGTVRFGGRPLERGEVTFVTADAQTTRVLTGEVHAGRYTLDGEVPPGGYKVFVIGPGVPAKYTGVSTSTLTVRVLPDGEAKFDIDLEK